LRTAKSGFGEELRFNESLLLCSTTWRLWGKPVRLGGNLVPSKIRDFTFTQPFRRGVAWFSTGRHARLAEASLPQYSLSTYAVAMAQTSGYR
jgi:hypothetical protein